MTLGHIIDQVPQPVKRFIRYGSWRRARTTLTSLLPRECGYLFFRFPWTVISSALLPSLHSYAVCRSFSNSLLWACCIRRAASVSLRAPAMRLRALMLSFGRRYCAGLSSPNKLSSGVW